VIYAYECDNCGFKFDVVKPATHYKDEEYCANCKCVSRRLFSPPLLTIDKTQPEFNHAFGKVIRNKSHRNEEAKKRGMVEIGNERPDVIHKAMDNQKAHLRKAKWDNVIKEL